MTPRAIRRAAERRASKLARKSAPETILDQPEPPDETPTKTPAILPAAAANAHLTATTSALTGHVTLLPATDAAAYDQLLRGYKNELQPVGLQESNLVQELADTIWRKHRLRALENAIFAKGRIEFAQQFAGHNPELRLSLIDVHTFLTYEKQIRGLQLQEARLSRRSDKASAELRTLQKERHQREERAREHEPETAAQHNRQQNGFEFANHESESFLTHSLTVRTNGARSVSDATPISC